MLSQSAANPHKFYWMRYGLDRATNLSVKEGDFKIIKNNLFGVREVRGTSVDEIMLKSGQTFKLDIKRSEILMNRSKEFKGVVKIDTALPRVAPTKKSPAVKSPVVVKPKSGIKIILNPLPKTKVTKLVQQPTSAGPIKVKLHEVELPHEDDFTDHELPAEFQRYARVESSATNGNWLTVLASSEELTDVGLDSIEEFNSIVKKTIEPHVKQAKGAVEAAVKEASAKIKAWALIHMQQARKLGRSADLFEKLVNDTPAAVRQLVHAMLGLKPNSTRVEEQKEIKELDDILADIKF